jgi:phosphate butyryltransferase
MKEKFVFQNFEQVVKAARELGRVTVAVAAAQDAEVIEAIKLAGELGLVNAILVGDAESIRPMAQSVGLPAETRIIHEPDVDQAALKAVELVHNGEAQVLLKGLINSSNFLRAALNPERGLRSGRILSHLAVFEIPGEKKLAFHVDGGMNIAPTLIEKKEILISAVEALHKMGIEKPNVAALTANELVNPKMPATLDAKSLVEMWQAGEFPSCVVEGPIAMDVAASSAAAHHKGISSQIAGNVDIFLVPDIEAGNMVGKTLVCYAKAKMAGVILGATHPIVLVSRSDNAESKVNSLALACLLASR